MRLRIPTADDRGLESADRSFEALVVQGIGRGAFETLRHHRIGVYQSDQARVGEILTRAREGTLSAVGDQGLLWWARTFASLPGPTRR